MTSGTWKIGIHNQFLGQLGRRQPLDHTSLRFFHRLVMLGDGSPLNGFLAESERVTPWHVSAQLAGVYLLPLARPFDRSYTIIDNFDRVLGRSLTMAP